MTANHLIWIGIGVTCVTGFLGAWANAMGPDHIKAWITQALLGATFLSFVFTLCVLGHGLEWHNRLIELRLKRKMPEIIMIIGGAVFFFGLIRGVNTFSPEIVSGATIFGFGAWFRHYSYERNLFKKEASDNRRGSVDTFSATPSTDLNIEDGIFPTWLIRELFLHIEPDLQSEEDPRCKIVNESVMDALSIGRLRAWGRNAAKFQSGLRAALEEINKSYWENASLSPGFFLERRAYRDLVHARSPTGLPGPQFRDIQVNKNQALRIWPIPAGRKWPDFMDDRHKFQLYEAACLFFDDAPILPMPARSQKLFDEWKSGWLANAPNRLVILVQLREAVTMAVDEAHGKEEKTFNPHMEVRRDSLVEWCEKHGERPRFLFKDQRG